MQSDSHTLASNAACKAEANVPIVREHPPGIYPLCCIYFIFIQSCLHIHLSLFGYYLTLSSCQLIHSLSHYYWNPPYFCQHILLVQSTQTPHSLQSPPSPLVCKVALTPGSACVSPTSCNLQLEGHKQRKTAEPEFQQGEAYRNCPHTLVLSRPQK